MKKLSFPIKNLRSRRVTKAIIISLFAALACVGIIKATAAIGAGEVVGSYFTATSTADTSTFAGPVMVGGAGERVQGSSSYIDFNQPANPFSMRLGSSGGTYNEYIDIDFDTTDNNVTFTGSGASSLSTFTFSDIGLIQTRTLPGIDFSAGLSVSSAKGDTAGNALYGIRNDFINSDTDLNSSAALYNAYTFGNVDRSTANDTAIASSNLINIQGAAGDIIASTIGGAFSTRWAEEDSGSDMSLKAATGVSAALRVDALDAGNELTIGNYDAFKSGDSGSDGLINVTGTLASFRAKNVSGNGGTIANQVGLNIENLTSGTANYGIVLDDGADCIYMGGTSGPKWCSGSGSPENTLSAPIGSMYSRTDGGAGTSFYIKESGTGNTGWVGK